MLSVTSRDMAPISGGVFRMGSDAAYPEERPAHEVAVDSFWIDRYAVTNVAFALFVSDTGYVTLAERPLDPALYPGARPAGAQALKTFLKPYPSEGMICWPVSTRVGNVRNNDPSLIEPIAA